MKMVTRRTAKSKGSQFEYDCHASLKQKFKVVYLTKERGFQRQFDIKIQDPRDNGDYYAVECKRLKGISWNQLVKFYKKLQEKVPDALNYYILFKSNQQPCLVFHDVYGYKINTFEGTFEVPFIKHESTRSK